MEDDALQAQQQEERRASGQGAGPSHPAPSPTLAACSLVSPGGPAKRGGPGSATQALPAHTQGSGPAGHASHSHQKSAGPGSGLPGPSAPPHSKSSSAGAAAAAAMRAKREAAELQHQVRAVCVPARICNLCVCAHASACMRVHMGALVGLYACLRMGGISIKMSWLWHLTPTNHHADVNRHKDSGISSLSPVLCCPYWQQLSTTTLGPCCLSPLCLSATPSCFLACIDFHSDLL